MISNYLYYTTSIVNEIFGICPSEGQWRWSKERRDKAIANYKRLQDELNKEEPSQEEIDYWYSKQP
ncbi:MAG: hypothetical protein Q3X12_01790, partial [Hallella sp.]|nr:hypothetical protein [Hallella sp.]